MKKQMTKWNPEMITNMVALVESKKSRKAGIAKAAKAFKITPMAVQVKYGRVKRAEQTIKVNSPIPVKKSTIKKTKSSIAIMPSSTFAGKNLFKIDSNTPLVGRRVSSLNKELHSLASVAKGLPIDSNKSICIPKTIAKTKGEASNLVLGLKRLAKESKEFSKDFTVTIRTVLDAEGKYSHSRIWRVA